MNKNYAYSQIADELARRLRSNADTFLRARGYSASEDRTREEVYKEIKGIVSDFIRECRGSQYSAQEAAQAADVYYRTYKA